MMCLLYLLSANFIIVTGVAVGIPALIELGFNGIEMMFYSIGILSFGVIIIVKAIDYIMNINKNAT